MESIGPLMETALQELGLRRVSSGGTGFGIDIRRLRIWVRRRTRFVNLRFKIGRFLNQDGSKLWVCGFLGKLEKRRHLTHEIIPAQHNVFPAIYSLPPSAKRGCLEFGSSQMSKSELWELVVPNAYWGGLSSVEKR